MMLLLQFSDFFQDFLNSRNYRDITPANYDRLKKTVVAVMNLLHQRNSEELYRVMFTRMSDSLMHCTNNLNSEFESILIDLAVICQSALWKRAD